MIDIKVIGFATVMVFLLISLFFDAGVEGQAVPRWHLVSTFAEDGRYTGLKLMCNDVNF